MKSLSKIVVVLSLCLFSLSLYGQSSDSTLVRKSPEERAKAQTSKLTKDLTLTADQSNKVEAIVLTRIQKTDALRGQSGGNRRQNFMQLRRVNQDYESSMKAVLTSDQYNKFQALQQENREKLKERRANRN